MSALLRHLFLLDPNIIFLNHGAFGACPEPVFDEYQRWQRELERQPVEFLGRRAADLLANARAPLAAYLGADTDEIVYFPNPTTAINMVARSLGNHKGLPLQPGNEILATDHEYGALDRTWTLICRKNGAKYIRRPIPLPVTTHANFVEHFWGGVTDRTRVIFISHITSPTALTFPVKEICRRAREAGILTIVDGAHAPGQIPINLHDLGCDIYTGACHKWLCAPKGSAFLYARRDVQAWLEPLVVSWGWGDEHLPPQPGMGETQFIRFHQWQGTRELASFLATPAAIEFQREHDWDAVRRACRTLARETRDRLNALTGLAPLCPDSAGWFTQLFAVRLPDSVDTDTLKARLYDEFRIEVPLHPWNNMKLMRVSIQGYNTREDADALVEALRVCL
ncbi:MAG TPA: aminotransferase class V-fold PLP-dependent enzyme [Anaerolineales bacterium]|nr:aminotransferase class V-fold PLP-dependent enzyme [Anaerolineales bacterium]